MKNKAINKKTLKISLVVIILIIIVITAEFILIVNSVEKIIDDIKIPEVNVETNFEKITMEGLEYSICVNIFNPNDIEIRIDEFSIVVKTDENKNVGSLSMKGGIIKPEAFSTFKSKGTIHFEALDAKILTVIINGEAAIRLGSFNENISLSTETKIFIPYISDFIFQNKTVDIELPVQFKLKARGILGIVSLKIFNPSEIPLVGKNLIFRIYRIDDEKITLLGEKVMDPSSISAIEQISVTAEILIPYRKFFLSAGLKFRPNWIMLEIEGGISIAGTRQVIPLSIRAYDDPYLIRIFNKR